MSYLIVLAWEASDPTRAEMQLDASALTHWKPPRSPIRCLRWKPPLRRGLTGSV